MPVPAAAITYERYDTKTLKRTTRRMPCTAASTPGLPGFSTETWSGSNMIFAAPSQAAIFNDPSKVKFVPLDASERFTELRKRKVNVFSRNTAWNLSREANYALHSSPSPITTGKLMRRARSTPAWSSDDTKLLRAGADGDAGRLAGYLRANNVKYQEVKFAKLDKRIKAYEFRPMRCFDYPNMSFYALRLD